MYFVYILECRDTSLYTGVTTDIARRLREHKSGRASKYTHAKHAVRIVYTEKKRSRSTALKREAAIKRMRRDEKLALIDLARA